MAIGLHTDFKIYEEQFYGGMFERVAQILEAFNAASLGAIVLETKLHKGHYDYESFMKKVTSLITRRDIGVTTDGTATKSTQDEFIAVKLNWRVQHEDAGDAWRKIGSSPAEMSLKLGQMAAEAKMEYMLNRALYAVETAIEGNTAMNYDATGQATKTMTHAHLVQGLKKFGDMADQVVMWVMHSTPWFDLMNQAITDNVYDIGANSIKAGTNATFGRRALVTDSVALTDANGSLADTYNTLGLVPGAVVVRESEDNDLLFERVGGKENIVYRYQLEGAFDVGVKGFKWDVANGGLNPTDAALTTTTNWDQAATADKHTAGIRVLTQ